MVWLSRNEKQTHRLISRPQMWPYEICYMSTKSGPIATRRKANISIWTLGLKFDNGFDLGHDLDIWIFKVICDLDHLVTKVRYKDLPDSDRGDFSCRRAVDSSSLSMLLLHLSVAGTYLHWNVIWVTTWWSLEWMKAVNRNSLKIVSVDKLLPTGIPSYWLYIWSNVCWYCSSSELCT